MSVLDDPNVENVVAVRDFVSTSRQPQTSPPLKMSLTDFPTSRQSVRNSAHGKGHEEGGLAYA